MRQSIAISRTAPTVALAVVLALLSFSTAFAKDGHDNSGSGSESSGHGSDDSGSDDHGGHHGSDDDAGDDHGGDTNTGSSNSGSGSENSGSTKPLASLLQHLEVRYTDGYFEKIDNGVLELTDPKGHTVARRQVTFADIRRLQKLLAGQ